MPKKPTLKGIFEKTETRAPGAPPKRKPIGVYLRQPTYDAIVKIAEDNNLKLHSLIAYAVTDFIKRYQAGKVKIETQSQPKPNLDL